MSDSSTTYDPQKATVLPCGRSIVVKPLDGHAQKRLTPNRDGKFEDLPGAITDALVRSILTLDGKRHTNDRLRDLVRRMPDGSRRRAFMLARTITYGSECRVTPKCPHCGQDNESAWHLDEIADIAYDPAILADGWTLTLQDHAGKAYRFLIGVESGVTDEQFQKFVTQGHLGPIDRPLALVKELDGKVVGPRALLDLPGDVLNALRQVHALTEPRTFLSPDHEAAWRAKALDLGRKLGVTIEREEPTEGEDEGDEKLWFPMGGPKTRVQLACRGCSKPFFFSLHDDPSFFFQHIVSALD